MQNVLPSDWYTQFVPITTAIGFLQAPLATVIAADQAWRASIGQYEMRPVKKPISQLMYHLFPLSAPLTRYLWVQTAGSWTAYFDNSLLGGDPYSPIPVLVEQLHCRGAIFAYEPSVTPHYGFNRFDFYDPSINTAAFSLARCVAAVNEDGHWSWTSIGTPLASNYYRYLW